jgi:hypothetical protein
MTGFIVTRENKFFVEHQDGKEVKQYELCEETLRWIEEQSTIQILKNTSTVEFEIVVKGEHCQTKNMLIKNYCAKIRLIDFDTIY